MPSIWRRSAHAIFLWLPTVRPWLSLAILLRFQILLSGVFFAFPFFARRAPGDALFGNLFVLGWVGQATITLTALVTSWVFLVTTALVVWHGEARIDQPCNLPFASVVRRPLFRVRMLVALALAAPNLAAVFIASGEELAGGGLKDHLLDLVARTGALVTGLLAAVVVFYLLGLLEAWLTPPQRPRSGLFPELPAWISHLHSLHPPDSQRRALAWLHALLRSHGFGPGYLDAQGEIGRGQGLAVGFTFLSAALYVGYGVLSCPLWAPTPMPALAGVLLVVLFLAWTLPALAFFFDRFRMPVLSSIALLSLVLFEIPGNDHFFAVLSPPKQDAAIPEPVKDVSAFGEQLVAGGANEPIVIAMAAGGGITSAAWTAKVLSELASDPATGAAFVRDLRLVSAVSGGSVGTMYFVDRMPAPGQRLAPEVAHEIWHSATESSLESVAWGMAYPDLLRGVVPWPLVGPRWLDRSWALENSWELRLRPGERTPTLRGWRQEVLAGRKPLVIFNSTVAETGDRFQFATLALAPRKIANQISGEPKPRCCDFFAEFSGRDLAIPTAVRLSSTFPFVSSAARAEGGAGPAVHFVDGGYYDNSGVLSALELLNRVFPGREGVLRGRPIVLLTLRVFEPDPRPLADVKPGNAWSTEVFSPVTTVAKVRTTTQAARNAWEIEQFAGRWVAKGLDVRRVDAWYNDIGPLSWRLTEMEKARIEKHWTKVSAQETMRELRRALAGRDLPLAPNPPNASPAAPELPVAQLEEWGRLEKGIHLSGLRSPWTITLSALWFLVFGRVLERQWRPLRRIASASVATWELVFSTPRARELWAAWCESLPAPRVRHILRVQLGLDFLFIPGYSLFLAAVCWSTAFWLETTRPASGLALDLAALAVLPWVAGCLDVIENLCLLASLSRSGPRQPWQALAGTAATFKFLLLGVVALGLLGAWFLA